MDDEPKTKRRWRTWAPLTLFAVVWIVLGYLLLAPVLRDHAALRALSDPDRIELTCNIGGISQYVVITDPREIRKVTATIVLKPKAPCECSHSSYAGFTRRGRRIDVSLCEHCFDVCDFSRKEHPLIGMYQMPPAFYREFLSHFNLPPASDHSKTSAGRAFRVDLEFGPVLRSTPGKMASAASSPESMPQRAATADGGCCDETLC